VTTMQQAYRGGSVVATGSYRVRVDGERLVMLDPVSGGLTATLPVATWLRCGPCRVTLINISGTYSVAIKLADGSTSPSGIATVGAGKVVECHLSDNSTSNGVWICRDIGTADAGSALSADRFPMELELTSSTTSSVTLRTMCIAKYPQWNRLTKAAVVLTIGEEGASSQPTIGSRSTSLPAISSGYFVTGSTLLIVNHGIVTGAGGNGGRGGGGLLSAAGSPGGDALRLYVDTVVLNHGTIQGGGGGGGGGGASGSSGGGGGGGGAGYVSGTGGLGYYGGSAGGSGMVSAGGAGGSPAGSATAGGSGGAPGTAGTAATSAGGAAGYCTMSQTGESVTVNNLGAGSTAGSAGTF